MLVIRFQRSQNFKSYEWGNVRPSLLTSKDIGTIYKVTLRSILHLLNSLPVTFQLLQGSSNPLNKWLNNWRAVPSTNANFAQDQVSTYGLIVLGIHLCFSASRRHILMKYNLVRHDSKTNISFAYPNTSSEPLNNMENAAFQFL